MITYRFLLLLFLIPFIFSCSVQKEPIKIGVVLPQTGPFKIYGQLGTKGAMLAVEEINRDGGVLGGHPLELLVRDNKTNPAESVRLTRQLIQVDGVFVLMGPVSSAARYAMQDVAAKYKVPQLYGIDYEGQHFSRYLICYSTIPEHYITPVVPYLIAQNKKSFYLFGYDYIWPHKMTEHIQNEVQLHGGTISGVEFTPFGVQDYSETFARIKASGATNLMLILPGQDGFNFLNQMSNYDFDRQITIMAFAADENYLSAVEPHALEGVLTALHFFSSKHSDKLGSFTQRYQSRFGQELKPTYSSKSHYDLVYLLKGAIEKAGKLDREAVLDALQHSSLYQGNSKVYLREDHHFNLPMYLARFQNGGLEVIHDLGRISPHDQRQAK